MNSAVSGGEQLNVTYCTHWARKKAASKELSLTDYFNPLYSTLEDQENGFADDN
ncbi:unnamed protein product [Brugia pahangi]|uniref:Uncharacterized protein n=1 Tax=Brugia pahangi TaxID=6280 RepID=A0A0N4T209_BRUPA|nr:unnamed protein product [Brugia pahangi]